MSYSAELAKYGLLVESNFVEVSESQKSAKRETIKENSTRPAVAELTFISTGVGQVRIEKPIIFGLAFRSEPHFTTGSATVLNPDAAHWHDPIGQAGVRNWQRDTRGYYIGAHIWLRTDMYAIDATGLPPAKTRTMHYLTFSALAIKQLVPLKGAKLSTRTIAVF